jgi:putative ABC transport system permease protein
MFEGILAADSEMLVFERDVSDLFFSSVKDEDWEKIRAMDVVAAAHPLLFGLVSAEGHPVITCFGLLKGDPRLSSATWLAGDHDAFGSAGGEIVLGQRAAGFLEAGLDDSVEIGNETFTVSGIIHTRNGFEDGGVFLPLESAREFFHRDGVSSILTVKLNDPSETGAFRKEIDDAFPHLVALENAEFNRGYSQFRIMRATSWAVGIAAFLLGGLGVANTMVLSVFVRIRELAILKSCGFSRGQVGSLIFGESLVVSAIGSLIGLGFGYGAIIALKHLPWLQGYVLPRVEWPVIIVILVVAALTGVAGAAYPARFAMNIETARALRYE